MAYLVGWLGTVWSVPVKSVQAFLRDESGATAIEYGLIAVGIAIAIITMVKGVGSSLNSAFSKVNSNLR